MCHLYAKHSLLSLLFLTASVSAFAQSPRANKENSPYSFYGLGEERNEANTSLKGMGYVSSAYSSDYYINTYNPASYAQFKLTTIEAGGEAIRRTINGNGDSYQTGRAGFSYFNFGIPLGKNAGMVFGVRPETRVYYRLDDTSVLPGVGNTYKTYLGDGGLTYAFVGLAGSYGGLSLGANFGYLFGTMQTSEYLTSLDGTQKDNNSEFSKYTKIGGIYWNGGALYTAKLNKKLALRFGANATLSQDMNASHDEYWITHSTVVSTTYDTAYRIDNAKGKVTLPMKYSGGIQLLSGDKWVFAVDYSAAKWSQYRMYGLTDSVSDSYKFSVGAEYTPDLLSMHKYSNRITYRLGFYYGTDYVHLNNTELNYYAVTAGASLPFKRATDRIHLALEVGKHGTQTNGLLQDNFVKFSLGLSFNDRWFVKRKYD